MTFQFFFEGVFTPSLGIFGVFGNLLSIKVLSSQHLDMTPSFRHLLKMLAAFDANFLVFTLALFCMGTWSETYEHFIRPWVSPYMLPIVQISLTGSVWTTMAVSFERYITVCLSYKASELVNSKKIHVVYTIPIVFCSVLFNIPRFFELRTEMNPTNVTIISKENGSNFTEERLMPHVVMTDIRKNPSYSRDYVMIANSVSLIVIPMLVLIILNSLIFRKISKANARHNAISSHQRRDHSVAKMLIIIVLVFVVCHSIRSIINMYECIQITLHGKVPSWPSWLENLIHFNHFALVINSSINILIYCWRDKKFLHVMLLTCGIPSRQQLSGTNRNRSARPTLRRDRNPSQSPNGNSATGSNSNVQLSPLNQIEMKNHSQSLKCSSSSVIQMDEDVDQVNVDIKQHEFNLNTVSEITNNNLNGSLCISSKTGLGQIKSDTTFDIPDEDDEESCCKCYSAGYTSESQSCTSIQLDSKLAQQANFTPPSKTNSATQIPSTDFQVKMVIKQLESNTNS